MANTVYNVVWRDDKWKVKKSGASRASATSERRPMAVKKARKFAKKNKPSQVKVRNKKGELVTRDDFGSTEPTNIKWEKKPGDRFHYTLRVSHPDKAFDSRYKIEVIGNSAEFIDYQAFGSDNKTRKTFESNSEALSWAQNKKRKVTRRLEKEGWRN